MDNIMKKVDFIDVPTGLKYPKYREYLRRSFNYSCAYCTISESESPGATFNIDHFRPVAFFSLLEDECENLRYSCPRCNSYKRDNWINKNADCIRDCQACKTKVCSKDIYRFINCLTEDPKIMLSLNDDFTLFAVNGSKPAEYSIKYLRLNRNQLIKLRKVRRLLDLWREDLVKLRSEAKDRLLRYERQLKEFEASTTDKLDSNQLLVNKLAVKQYEILGLTSQHYLDFVEDELNRLDQIMGYRIGDDSHLG